MNLPLINLKQIDFYYGDRPIIQDLSLELHSHESVFLLGPNGAGKSTLLKLALGLLAPHRGKAFVKGRPIASLSSMERARQVAFVPQDSSIQFSFTVREIVAMGRYPHSSRFQPESSEDHRIIDQALEDTDTFHLRSRGVNELSGGERQRVMIARALAQQTPVIFFDEPTANLDVPHQLEIMELIQKLSIGGKGVLTAIHDLSFAVRYASRAVILVDGRLVENGTPDLVLTESKLEEHFKIISRSLKDGNSGIPFIVPVRSCHPAKQH